jgi:hypothetical protein
MDSAVMVGDGAGGASSPTTSTWSRWGVKLAGLFPAAEVVKTPRARVVAWYLAAFVASVGYLLLIPAGRLRLNHVWAEDGARFYLDARTRPFGSNLVSSYEGYLHTVPRLAAEVVAQLPLSWAAAGMAVAAAMLRAGVALLVFTASGGFVRSRPARLAVAALVVLAPVGNSEALDNLANFHWFGFYCAFWLLLWRPTKRWQSVLAAVALFLAATTSAVVVLFAPLALARFALAGRRQAVVTAGFWAGAVVQVVSLLTSSRDPYFSDSFDVKSAALAALLRVPMVAFSNSEDVAKIYAHFAYWPALVVVVVVLGLAAAVFRWGSTPLRVLVIAALGYSVLYIFVDLKQNWHTGLRVGAPGVVLDGQRYSVASSLLLLTVVVIGLDQLPRAVWRRLGAVAVAAVLLTGLVRQLPATAYQLTGTPWDQTVDAAKRECAQGASAVTLQQEPAGWSFKLPCQDVG